MIAIDFQGGQHGNYLEFVCNKFLAGVKTDGLPFNQHGAAHFKKYLGPKKFIAHHYFEYLGKRTTPTSGKIISIRINVDDLLPLASISLLRAGDHGLDNNKLHINTYNKLNNVYYRWVLDTIIEKFFKDQVEKSYNNIRDPTWPDIKTVDDFNSLPDHIKKECIEQHNFQMLEISESKPDCPRPVLIEFFKLGFKHPENFGFMTQQEKMYYNEDTEVFYFPFSCFYDSARFFEQIEQIGRWSGYQLKDKNDVLSLHQEFLKRQIYKDSKIYCDDIFDKMVSNQMSDLPMLDLLQESYLLARLERYYNDENINDINYYIKSS